MNFIWLALAAGAGAGIALQATVNGSLRANIDSPWYASYFSIWGTFLTANLFLLLVRPALPAMNEIGGTPWWNWIGGPLGALIVLSGAALIPKLGAAAFIAAVVGGQLLFSLVLDHFGWLDLTQRTLTPGRLLGAVMVFSGVMMVKLL